MLETQGADVAELFLAVPFGPEAKIQAPQIKIPTNLLWSSEPFYFYSLSLSVNLTELYGNKFDYNMFEM